VEGIYDLRIKAVLDNGVEIRELLLDAEMTHQLTDGINLEKAKEMAHAALDQSVVFTEFEGMIIRKYYEVSGNNTGRYLIVKTDRSGNDETEFSPDRSCSGSGIT